MSYQENQISDQIDGGLLKQKALELNKQFVNNISSEELEMLMSEFDKYETDVQLLQTTAIGSVCKHCNNKLCDSQTFNQQCLKCGKKPL